MVRFLSLILRVKTIRRAIKAVKSGKEVDLERWFVMPTAASKQEIISTGQADKVFGEGKSRNISEGVRT